MTPKYIFVIPHGSIGVLGMVATSTKYSNTAELLSELEGKLAESETGQIEQGLQDFLPEDRILEVSEFKKLSVKVGFWLLAGMKIAKVDGNAKVINVQPKAQRAARLSDRRPVSRRRTDRQRPG